MNNVDTDDLVKIEINTLLSKTYKLRCEVYIAQIDYLLFIADNNELTLIKDLDDRSVLVDAKEDLEDIKKILKNDLHIRSTIDEQALSE